MNEWNVRADSKACALPPATATDDDGDHAGTPDAKILQVNTTLTYKIAIPPSYYDTPVSLLNAINKGLQYDAEFVYDEWSKRCTVNLKERVSVKLWDYFSTLLRLAPVLLLEERIIGDSEIGLRQPISNVLVHRDILEPSFIGSGRYPILKMAPFLYE